MKVFNAIELSRIYPGLQIIRIPSLDMEIDVLDNPREPVPFYMRMRSYFNPDKLTLTIY